MDSPLLPSPRARAGYFRAAVLAAGVASLGPRASAAPASSPAPASAASTAPAAQNAAPVADPFKALQDIANQNAQKWQLVNPDIYKKLQEAQTSAQGQGDYKKLQDAAPEVVVLKIASLNTDTVRARGGDASQLMVTTVKADVVSAVRSRTGLGPGAAITISYGFTAPSAAPAANAPAMPVLSPGQQYLAYLSGGPSPASYYVAAGPESFLDPAAATLAASGKNPGAAVAADPSLLPTPTNPGVPGVVKMVPKPAARPGYEPDPNALWLDDFGTVKQGDDGLWYADLPSIPHLLPLKTYDKQQPVLLDYYIAPARAPAGQPSVLIYSAGTIDANNPSGVPLNIEWALILDPKGNILGDAMWAARKTTNGLAVPLPVWIWSTYKLEVQEPYNPVTKEISLIPADGILDGSVQLPVKVNVIKQAAPAASAPADNTPAPTANSLPPAPGAAPDDAANPASTDNQQPGPNVRVLRVQSNPPAQQ